MCGITGYMPFSSSQKVDRDILIAMTNTIVHRGPDEDGYFINQDRTIGLGHRRLSIIDVASGQQPIPNEDATLNIIFNGEIYNFQELRIDLLAKGHVFRTHSDTEVILHCYEEYGIKAFDKLNGIFALAIWNEGSGELILARDHFGVKPLYYSFTDGILRFGSEIKPILAHPVTKRSLDLSALYTFLTYRCNPSPETLFQTIHKLPAGHALRIKIGQSPEIFSFVEEVLQTNTRITESEALEEYTRLLRAAVRRQMVSDVPVGLLLSGGVDSALLGKLMTDYSSAQCNSYSIGFEGKGDFNELDDAAESATILGTNHHQYSISKEEYLQLFVQSFYYTEEPIAMTTIPAMFSVSKLAAKDVKVVLAGQGADEPWAGYPRYTGEKLLQDHSNLLSLLPLGLLSKTLPRNERLKRFAFIQKSRNDIDRFIGIHTIFTPAMIQEFLLPEIREQITDSSSHIFERLYSQTNGLDSTLDKLLYIDSRSMLPDNLLLFNDKMSMANSLEMRVPYLDRELMAFVEQLPSTMKIRGSYGRYTQKYLHKKASEQILPQRIVTRPKRGFSTPMDEWLQGDLAIVCRRLFNEPDSAVRRYFVIEKIDQMLELHHRRKQNYQRHIFALLCFELWYRNFFEEICLPNQVQSNILFS